MSDAIKHPMAPFRAYIPTRYQTGPDTWESRRNERIVWATFEGLALTSSTHGSDLRVMSFASLKFEIDQTEARS